MPRLFVRALTHSVLWAIWMVGCFAFFNWLGWTSYILDNVWFWVGVVVVMTIVTMVTIPLDERYAKDKDHKKRMKERGFE